MATAKGARNAAVTGAAYLAENEKRILGELEAGYGFARGDAENGMQPLRDLSARYQGGSEMYSNALGLGGQQGATAARDAFQTGPGYQFAMDQGLDSLDRRAASRGRLGSGNTMQAGMQFSQGLANQEWGNWLNRLQGYDTNALSAANSEMGQGRYMSDLTNRYFDKKVGVVDDTAKQIIGMNNAALKAGDQAKAQNEANLMAGINTGVNILSSAFGMPTGGGGGAGGGLSSFMKMFGG